MNIEEIDIYNAFDITIELCQLSYDPSSKGKDLLEGQFPVLFKKIGNTLYVAFRGTRNDFSSFNASLESISNMIVDVSAGDLLGENTPLSDYEEFKRDVEEQKTKLTAHAGFLTELAKYYFDIKQKIEPYYNDATNVVFTGHSAGGALATLMYYVYINDFRIEKKLPVYYTITYGSPRVIRDSIENKDLYNNSCPNLIRCFNANDIVTYIPFKNPTPFIGSIGSGFTHVGFPLPMDTNIESNTLNGLILQVIRGNKDIYSEIFKKYSFDELRQNEIIELIVSDRYLGLMGDCMFKSYEKVGVKQEVSDEMIKAQTNKILNHSQDILNYILKCNLASPLGIDEILKTNNIYNSEVQQDIGISGIYGSLMKQNKISVQAHDLKEYRNNANKLETMSFKEGFNILEKKSTENTLPILPKPVTTREITIDLINEFMLDLQSGKIIGAVSINEEELPAVLEIK